MANISANWALFWQWNHKICGFNYHKTEICASAFMPLLGQLHQTTEHLFRRWIWNCAELLNERRSINAATHTHTHQPTVCRCVFWSGTEKHIITVLFDPDQGKNQNDDCNRLASQGKIIYLSFEAPFHRNDRFTTNERVSSVIGYGFTSRQFVRSFVCWIKHFLHRILVWNYKR